VFKLADFLGPDVKDLRAMTERTRRQRKVEG
jgi:hypothetical protein